jgi:metal-responsive CopG/Arc/MetJ family transcriptional regulator
MDMKTAISIPDDVFAAAEQLARRQGLSRSALYRRAVERYLAEHEIVDITVRLDEVYSGQESDVDPRLLGLAVASLPNEEW